MGYPMCLSGYLDPYPVLFHGVSLCLNNSLTHPGWVPLSQPYSNSRRAGRLPLSPARSPQCASDKTLHLALWFFSQAQFSHRALGIPSRGRPSAPPPCALPRGVRDRIRIDVESQAVERAIAIQSAIQSAIPVEIAIESVGAVEGAVRHHQSVGQPASPRTPQSRTPQSRIPQSRTPSEPKESQRTAREGTSYAAEGLTYAAEGLSAEGLSYGSEGLAAEGLAGEGRELAHGATRLVLDAPPVGLSVRGWQRLPSARRCHVPPRDGMES